MWVVIGTIAIVIATISAGVLLDRRFSILPRPERLRLAAKARRALPAHADGEAPATAIAVTPRELERIRRRRCPRCQRTMQPTADDPILYEGRTLRVLAFTCPPCAVRDRVYVEPR